MIDIKDRELLEAAYARGGRKEAIDALLDTLIERGGEWSDERLRNATRFIRDLPRDEAQVVSA